MKKFLTLITAFSLCIGLLFFSNTKKTAVKAADSQEKKEYDTAQDLFNNSVDFKTSNTLPKARKAFSNSVGIYERKKSSTEVLVYKLRVSSTETADLPIMNLSVTLLTDVDNEGNDIEKTISISTDNNKYVTINKENPTTVITFDLGTMLDDNNSWKTVKEESIAYFKTIALTVEKDTIVRTLSFFKHVHVWEQFDEKNYNAKKEATCTEKGLYTSYAHCSDSDCNKYFVVDEEGNVDESQEIPGYMIATLTISEKGHNVVQMIGKEPTCTEDGYLTYYYCFNCKKYFSDKECTKEVKTNSEKFSDKEIQNILVRSKTKHDFGNWVVVKEATCTESGQKQRICKKCGYVDIVDIDSKNHEHKTHVEKVDATFEKEGHEEYWHCDDCGKDFSNEACTEEGIINLPKNVVSAQVGLGKKVSVYFTSALGTTMTIRYVVDGETLTYTINGVVTTDKMYNSVLYRYTFEELALYNIEGALTISFEGTEGSFSFSVYNYLQNIYKDSSTATQQLITDFIYYVAALKDNFGYESMNTAFVGNQSTCTIGDNDNKRVVPEVQDENNKVSSVSLVYNNSFKLLFAYNKENATKINVYKNGSLISDGFDIDETEVLIKDISAKEFATLYTVELVKADGTAIKYTFSVNAYIFRLDELGSAAGISDKELKLALAVYRYGRTASSYTE